MNSIWMNLGIEEYSFWKLATELLPQCDFPILAPKQELVELAICYPELVKNNALLSPRFHYITKEEESDIFAGKWMQNHQYELEDWAYGFYFPDCSLILIDKVIPGGFDKIIDERLEKHFYEDGVLVYSKRLLYRAVFIILHEYGHYISYKRFSGDKVAYVKYVSDAKEKFNAYNEMLKTQENISTEEIEQRLLLYRNSEEEKFADDYAMEHLEEYVQLAILILKQNMRNEG